MSDLEHLEQRLTETAGPDERFALTITEEFIPDGFGGHKGKRPHFYITRWTFRPVYETGTAAFVAKGSSVKEVMRNFEAWLNAREAVAA